MKEPQQRAYRKLTLMTYGVQQMVTQERTTNMGATVAHRNGNINGTQSLKIPCHPEVEVENYFDTW